MKRDVDIREISDGKFYTANDMVKAETGGCKGCIECCKMVDTIILDPWDLYHLARSCGAGFSGLMQQGLVELNLVDGLILPNLKMQADMKACGFLSAEGRCKVHDARPGFCRLFPLGRYYEGRDFRYIIQVHECANPNLAKVKVKKWLGIPELKKYEDYIREWHYFLTDVEQMLDTSPNPNLRKQVDMYIVNQFFATEWDILDDFYEQFEIRLSEARRKLGWA